MEAMRIVGNDFVISEHPQINAQFSAAYAVAAALLRDEVVLDMFSDEAISGNEDIATGPVLRRGPICIPNMTAHCRMSTLDISCALSGSG